MPSRKKGSGIYKRTKPVWNKGKLGFMKGKKLSDEHKKKIAEALKDNKNGTREIKKTKEEKKQVSKNGRLKNKYKVLSFYSQGEPECVCCGEDKLINLSIDHIKGGGKWHRIEIFGRECSGSGFYLWLISNGFPDGYQVLCLSCNKSKGTGDFCKKHNK